MAPSSACQRAWWSLSASFASLGSLFEAPARLTPYGEGEEICPLRCGLSGGERCSLNIFFVCALRAMMFLCLRRRRTRNTCSSAARTAT